MARDSLDEGDPLILRFNLVRAEFAARGASTDDTSPVRGAMRVSHRPQASNLGKSHEEPIVSVGIRIVQQS